MESCLPAMLNLWAKLRMAHHLYWTLHWQAKGSSFYGDHSLFQGLYQARIEEIDNLAELIAAHYGSSQLDPVRSWAMAQECIMGAVGAPSPVSIAEMVLEAVEEANEACMECAYPAGTTNLIADIGTNHLKALYMLKQRYMAGPTKL